MTFGSPCMVHSGFLGRNWPETVFRMLLNQFEAEGNRSTKKAAGTGGNQWDLGGFQQAASAKAGAASCAGSSLAAWRLCGQPEQHSLAQAPRASSMMVLIVRAQRPHSALQPRQP